MAGAWYMGLLAIVLLLHLNDAIVGDNSTSGALRSCNLKYLVTVTNQTDGITVAIHPETTQPGTASREISSKTITGRYLSPECGEHYFRCQKLYSVTSMFNGTIVVSHITFVPIANGLLLVEWKHNDAGYLTYSSHHIVESKSEPCSPTAVMEIQGGIYTVCVNSEYVAVFQIYLNDTIIQNTQVSSILMRFNLQTPSHLSNFVYVSLASDTSSQLIYFSTTNYLHALVPLADTFYGVGELGYCSLIDTLRYSHDDVMLAYCYDNNSVVSFDLQREFWINQTIYKEDGKPYPCPNPDVYLAVFPASYVQYRVWSNNSLENFNIPGMDFDSGVCVGRTQNTLFAYTDPDSGVFLLRVSNSTVHELSSKRCIDSCEPLIQFDDRYLIVREKEVSDAKIFVVDVLGDLSHIIESEHTQADLVTLVQDVQCVTPTDPPIVILPPAEDNPSGNSSIIAIVIIATVIGVFVFLFFVTVVIGFSGYGIYMFKYKRSTLTHPLPETGQPNNDCEQPSRQPPVQAENQDGGPSFARPGVLSQNHHPPLDNGVPAQNHVYPAMEQSATTEAGTVGNQGSARENAPQEGATAKDPPSEVQSCNLTSETDDSGLSSPGTNSEPTGSHMEPTGRHMEPTGRHMEHSTIKLELAEQLQSTPQPGAPTTRDQAPSHNNAHREAIKLETIDEPVPPQDPTLFGSQSSGSGGSSTEQEASFIIQSPIQEQTSTPAPEADSYVEDKDTDHLLPGHEGLPRKKLLGTVQDWIRRDKIHKNDPERQDIENRRQQIADLLQKKD